VNRIYLDHAATTPLRPQARAAMEQGFRIWANPSSPHAEGRKARAALEDARARVKAALGWEGEVIFTSGASEALAIGLGRAKAERRLVSAVEHDAVFRAAPDAQVLPIGARGQVDGDKLREALALPGRPVVAVQHVNSETGVIQPITALTREVNAAGGLLLSDCSQSAGKFRLPLADMIVVSAHKLGGPIGIGALLVRDYEMLEPSGGQERGYRAGTENLPAALGFAAALEARHIGKFTVEGGDSQPLLFDGIVDWLVGVELAFGDIAETVRRHGGQFQPPACERLDRSILSITMPGVSAAAQLIQFDAAGIAVSAGSACSSGTLKPSRTLLAFGVPPEDAANTIRVSVGWNTRPEEIAKFADVWAAIAGRAGAKG